jgi:cobalt-zinc-cadmium efflux system protein
LNHDHHDHDHDHEHGHHHDGSHGRHHHHNHATGNIRIALTLNLLFSLIELVGGLYTQSIAVLSDALHDFGDSLALGTAWYLQEKSEKGADAKFSYGYRRLSLLSAIFTGMFLVIGSLFVLKESISRFNSPVTPNTQGMALLAILGIAVNGFAAWKVGRGKSMNERVISLHMLEDLLGWVTVLIGSIIMTFADLPWIDPVLSIGFTLFILRGVYRSLGGTIKLFLQAVPDNINLPELLSKVRAVDGVLGVHDCHVWSLDGESHVLTMHVIVDLATTVPAIEVLKHGIRKVVEATGKFHLTIEVECDPASCPGLNCVLEN